MLNIHPLLPKYKGSIPMPARLRQGINAQAAPHEVTAALMMVRSWANQYRSYRYTSQLAVRVLVQEHQLYPVVLNALPRG